MKGCLKFVGFIFLGFVALGVVASIFGGNSRSDRSGAVTSTTARSSENVEQAQIAISTAPNSLFDTICKTDPDWTEVQTEKHLASFAGQEITDWNGYVYEVSERLGEYVVLVAMSSPGLLWTRDIEIYGVPEEVAVVLNKEQPIQFSGRIARVDRSFGSNCNPIVVEDPMFPGVEVASGSSNVVAAVNSSTTLEVTFSNICETDPNWTEVQTEKHLEGFVGREIIDWDGYIYEVTESSGQYNVMVAMEPPGLLWSRNIEIVGVSADLAVGLQKEQSITFSGQISRVDRSFGTNCNPIVVKDATFAGMEGTGELTAAAAIAVDPTTIEATFNNICKTDPDWTEIQTQQHLDSFIGREITNWDGYVYEVTELGGQYSLMIAMEPPGMLWARNVEIPGIPAEMAVALQKEQPIRFSGRLSRVDRSFGTNCNPIVVQDATFAGFATADDSAAAPTLPDSTTIEATFSNICKTDPDWTEIQTQAYLAGFIGRDIFDWAGYVYEVRELGGQYELLVAMEPPGLLWARNVEIPGISAETAVALQKEQPIRFSGTLSRVDRSFGTNCNPIVVQDATLVLN